MFDTIKIKTLTVANKIQDNKYMKAISNAMMALMPIMMVSSVASLLKSINFWGIGELMANVGITSILTQINTMTIDIISIYVAFLVAYKLGENLKGDAVNCGLMGVMSFFILTNLTKTEEFTGFDKSVLGSTGMFVAMFGALLGAKIYTFCTEKNWTIKMPQSVPPVVSKSFGAIIPGCVVALVMGIIYQGFAATQFGDIASFIYAMVQKPITAVGANIWAAMFIVAFIELLWFFGIHGVLAVYPILMLVFYEPGLANLSAYGAGEALPHLFTLGFIINNRGARSLAVALLCIFNSKSQQLRSVGKVGLIPAAFQISEPIKFGIPQVMNIRMLFPLMLTPAVSVLSAYLLTIVGFLPYHNGVQIPSGFPAIFCGFLFNGWQGIVAQILQLVLCTLIYIPFIKSQDKYYLAEEAKVAAQKQAEASVENVIEATPEIV